MALVSYGNLKTPQAEAGDTMQTISSRTARLRVQLRAANSRHTSEEINVHGGFFCFDVSLLSTQRPSSLHLGSERGKKRKAARQKKPPAAAAIREPFGLDLPILGQDIMTNADAQLEALRAAIELVRGTLDDEQLAVGEIATDHVRTGVVQDQYRASRKQFAEMFREVRR